MPSEGCQTEISFTVNGCKDFVSLPISGWPWLVNESFGDDEDEVVDWVESSSDTEASTGDETQADENMDLDLTELQYNRAWPPFPQDYFRQLGNKHCRWGGSKSYKKEVPALDFRSVLGSASWRAFAHDWVVPRFNLWLKDRCLQNKLEFVRVAELPDPIYRRTPWFLQYDFKPAEGRQFNDEVVYHGTYGAVLARILHTGRLHESDNKAGLGMESHHPEPVVYTAETLIHALWYGFASSLLKDNLYYKVVLQCEVNSAAVKRRHKGEVMAKSGDVVIRSVLLFFNCEIAQGDPKCADWGECEMLELLPFHIGEPQLRFTPLRRSAWGEDHQWARHPRAHTTCLDPTWHTPAWDRREKNFVQ